MRRTVPAAIATLLAAAAPAAAQVPCGDVLGPPCPTPTPTVEPAPTPTATPKPRPARVTLRSTRSTIRSGAGVGFRGRVRGADDFQDVSLIKRLPDGSERVIGFTYPESGRFRFYDEPSLNTTYRVAVAGVESRPVRTGVLPRAALESRFRRDGLSIRLTVFLTYDRSDPRAEPGRRSRGHFYVRLSGERLYRRVGTARLGGVRRPLYTCSRTAHLLLRDRALLPRVQRTAVCYSGRPFEHALFNLSCGARLRLDGWATGLT